MSDTDSTNDTVSATTTVDATPEEVFEYLRRPANHRAISGDGSVRGEISGPEVLSEGDRFGMSMRIGLPYRVTSQVVEFEPNRRIAWAHFGGHRWRWELEGTADGQTEVTETYDISTSKTPWLLRLIGMPGRQRSNVETSVSNVAAHFAARTGPTS